MSGSPTWALQQAVYTRLATDTTLLQTLGAQVYDFVPDGAPFPYVTIGDVTEVANDTMGTTHRDLTIKVDEWAQSEEGMKEVMDIQNRVDALLDRWAPTVAGWTAGTMLNEFFETFRDPDGITRRGSARYRIHIQES